MASDQVKHGGGLSRPHRRPVFWLGALALVCSDALTALPAVGQTAQASDESCIDSGDGGLHGVERCTQRQLSAAQQALQQTLNRIRAASTADQWQQLSQAQQQWRTLVEADCRLFVQLAASGNPAWEMTWGNVARDGCLADQTEARVAWLHSLLALADDKEAQLEGFRSPG